MIFVAMDFFRDQKGFRKMGTMGSVSVCMCFFSLPLWSWLLAPGLASWLFLAVALLALALA